jgi:alanyl-tRNA synthetase
MSKTTPSAPPTAAAELRRAFLDFFIARGHAEVPSSPLVPNDPTLLFTTAGMVQFKPYYTAAGDLPYTRATSVQKCLRLTDLDNVGFTPRHGTFFEMLGNFSFGPKEKGAYFKEEAIAMAWEFTTRVLGLPADRLYPSVFAGEGQFPRDDEAIELWKKMGVPESRIVPLGRADNFWGPAGGQGACGPCSEIYFDLGEARRPARGRLLGRAPRGPGGPLHGVLEPRVPTVRCAGGRHHEAAAAPRHRHRYGARPSVHADAGQAHHPRHRPLQATGRPDARDTARVGP